MPSDPEARRLRETREQGVAWKQWGPYLSERQWGTVREDYSADGDAWGYFTHEQARSRAYVWGEDGLAGVSDDKQRLCFALALWNGHDSILKERLFGLTNAEGNHGEDVKEYYFYLDSTPTHSYMRYLYKYPQAAFPYAELVEVNAQRTRHEPEYELLDTGVFDDDCYFDVFVTYAKASPTDLLIEIEAVNRGPQTAPLSILPTLWFRNTWSWGAATGPKPRLQAMGEPDAPLIGAFHPTLGSYFLYLDEPAPLLFTENETNCELIFGEPNRTPYVKDGIANAVVHGRGEAVNPEQVGSKAAAHYHLLIGSGQSGRVRLRLTFTEPPRLREVYADSDGDLFGAAFDAVLETRREEADQFYAGVIPASVSDDERAVARQALAGMLWTKQFYCYDVTRWLQGHGTDPAVTPAKRLTERNRQWFHLVNEDIISMPDKWEYPWYAAWDLAFHCLALNMVDPDFAKDQLALMLHPNYLHPNGQIPAYEWNFSDVNPPVHAWAVFEVYRASKAASAHGDLDFLKASFQKLLMNFTWWVNRKDPGGANVFEGGFLGLDNIGVFDRSAPLPTGGRLEQADGTAWMAFYSQIMFQMALELAQHDPMYEQMAIKFFEHILWIVAAMDRAGEHADELWDEEDGFFYDVLRIDNEAAVRLKVRSVVGLLSLCACTIVGADVLDRAPGLVRRAQWLNEQRPELTANLPSLDRPGAEGRRLVAVLDEKKLRRVLERMLDEREFLSDYGIRALSRCHLEQPYIFYVGDQEYRVDYEPAESTTGQFGGNSNWRGPIWCPTNALLIRALMALYAYYGDEFTVECPTGSGRMMNLYEVAQELGRRLGVIFLRDAEGRRPVYGACDKFQTDPHWRDYILFYEYFNGDNGAGLGASHQTGWTGLVARLIELFAPPVTSSGARRPD